MNNRSNTLVKEQAVQESSKPCSACMHMLLSPTNSFFTHGWDWQLRVYISSPTFPVPSLPSNVFIFLHLPFLSSPCCYECMEGGGDHYIACHLSLASSQNSPLLYTVELFLPIYLMNFSSPFGTPSSLILPNFISFLHSPSRAVKRHGDRHGALPHFNVYKWDQGAQMK